MANMLALEVDNVPSHATASLFSSTRQRRLPTQDDWQHTEFSFEPFIKRDLGIALTPDSYVCPRFAAGRCDLGPHCPLRHEVTPSPSTVAQGRDLLRRTVCKHWLRGLCKKGDACDYLHEYDLRRMPECRFYATYGFCNATEECLYIHIAPEIKRRECELYRRGFCPKGPKCEKKHIRRIVCPYYIAGFCPLGRECNRGHPKSFTPSAESRRTTPVLTHRALPSIEAFGGTGMPANELPIDTRTGRAIVSAADWAAAAAARRAPEAAAARDAAARRRELSEILCYKCGEYGHFANACPNQNRPGNRGGMDRGRWN